MATDSIMDSKHKDSATADSTTDNINVDRAIRDLRAALPVVVYDEPTADSLTMWQAEAALYEGMFATKPCHGDRSYLLITAARAQKLGYKNNSAVKIAISAKTDIRALAEIIIPGTEALPAAARNLLHSGENAGATEIAALQLLKYSALLPAALITRDDRADKDVAAMRDYARRQNILAVSAAAISDYRDIQAQCLEIVAQAALPLEVAENAQIAVFAAQGGGAENLAIIIGAPDKEAAPLVRVHSSCLTGDLLGSLRCDCGAQLQAALQRIADAGNGVIIYLNQEGRGIGIANKIRAYSLQDTGLDTLDANEQLGFDGDERHFRQAAEMLKTLGITNIRMLTNNPGKMHALTRYGIRVAERLPLVISAGEHNRSYLETKIKRCGHIF